MAIIGLDIDGVLTDIHQFEVENGRKFFEEKFQKSIVDYNAQDIDDIFGCSKEESKAFWTKY